MLFKSGDNLWSGALDFISESEEVSLFSAYIRTEQLKELNKQGKINRIVVRWEIRDLHQGASDLELYSYCKENKITLFRNTRIHLKCLLNEKEKVFLGSANITGRGIGEKSTRFNFELNSINTDIDFGDTLYLDRIISQSEYVSEELFRAIKSKVEGLEDFKKQEEEYQKVDIMTEKKESDHFLISELPMFKDVKNLYQAAQNINELSPLDRRCVSHDLATYNLSISKSKDEFYSDLRQLFNSHKFIVGLKTRIKEDRRGERSLHYGGVVRWITENTTTVPTPISWELKKQQVVNILYEWICFLDSDFVVEKPGYSEIIYYRP
jgi:phosphatidylserine/phosphatidylglycerophosphate/cardiolipin synthase-like enzyme